MMKLAVFALVTAMASCQAPVAEPSPQSCCTPRQWVGIQAGIGGMVAQGQPQGLTTTSWVAFDRTGKRIFAYTNTTTAQGNSSVKTIQDYKAGFQWTINMKDMTCTKSNLTTPFNDGCIPDDAKFLGKFYFGAGNEMIHGKSFVMHKDQLDITVSVTEDLCVPLSESMMGAINNVPTLITLGFVNIVPKIPDPSVFKPPSMCKENARIPLPPSHVESKYHILHI